MTIVPRYRDLLTQVLAGGGAPICPVFAHCHHPNADQDAEVLAAATLAWQDRFDMDMVKLTPASTWQLHDLGLESAHDPDDPLGRRRVTRTIVHHPDDWQRLALLDPGRGFAAHIVRAAGLIRKHLPDAVPLLATLYSPASLALKLAPAGVAARHRSEAPEALAAGLAILTENCRRLVASLIDAGIDGLFLAVQAARAPVIASDDYARLGLAGDLSCLEAASPLPFNVLHLHGDGVHHRLFHGARPALLHYEMSPGNPAPESLLALGGLSTGPSPTGLIAHGTPAQCAEEVGTLRRRLAGPGFVLAPGCSLPLSTPPANLQAMVAAARTPDPRWR